jgi:hypothetical protein
MSCNTLVDGTGNGYQAAVNSSNRLEVQAVTTPTTANISQRDGQCFIVASDFVSLTTTGSFNGIMYVKNTATDKDLHIEKLRACGDGSGSVQLRVIKNPTSGTLISDANSADINNANLSSAVAFSGLAYAASADGKTVTDGTNFTQFISMLPGHTIQEYSGAIILGPGDSMAITAKPSASSNFCIEVQCYFEDM